MRLLVSLLLLIQLAVAYKTFKGVIVADDNNFEQIIRTKGKYTFINFYSQRCDHCQLLGPRYEALATAFKGSDVQIVQIEARENRRVRNEQGIVGFPVLRLYHFDGSHLASFSNRDRTTEELANFLTEHTGVQPRWPESKVTVLKGSESVDEAIANNTKRIVVAFAAPWLANWNDRFNEYERLAEKFTDVKFYKLDGTLEENAEIVSKYRVSVFPTLVYFDLADSPKFRVLEEQAATENKMSAFLQLQSGDEYEDLNDLMEAKSAGEGDDDGSEKPGYGFNKYGVGSDSDADSDNDDDEKWKKLREL